MTNTLVLGLGNPILTDDGVGIHVVRAVAARGARDNVAFAEASAGGLRLLEIIAGYARLVIVDAIQTREGKPGEIYRLHADDLRMSLHAGSTSCAFSRLLPSLHHLKVPRPFPRRHL